MKKLKNKKKKKTKSNKFLIYLHKYIIMSSNPSRKELRMESPIDGPILAMANPELKMNNDHYLTEKRLSIDYNGHDSLNIYLNRFRRHSISPYQTPDSSRSISPYHGSLTPSPTLVENRKRKEQLNECKFLLLRAQRNLISLTSLKDKDDEQENTLDIQQQQQVDHQPNNNNNNIQLQQQITPKNSITNTNSLVLNTTTDHDHDINKDITTTTAISSGDRNQLLKDLNDINNIITQLQIAEYGSPRASINNNKKIRSTFDWQASTTHRKKNSLPFTMAQYKKSLVTRKPSGKLPVTNTSSSSNNANRNNNSTKHKKSTTSNTTKIRHQRRRSSLGSIYDIRLLRKLSESNKETLIDFKKDQKQKTS